VGELLKLEQEKVATQVVPRDRHAQVILALAQLGASLERLAVEMRHLQRTEVGEVVEGFTPGQKGSSAMPHKKNPISGENITGLSRMLRSYASVALENVPLWHERDISHSSAERVMFPDAFILADYATSRMNDLIKGLYVDAARMRENLDISMGQTFSSHVLLALVDKGLSREEAYKMVQRASHSLKKGENLLKSLSRDKEVSKYLKMPELKAIFSGKKHIQAIQDRFKALSKDLRSHK
jgi:adenylosuccinate lyase